MKVSDVVEALGLQVAAGEAQLSREVLGGYCGDLLSDVMARAKPKDVWITIQGHQNIVAVAVLTEISGVIVCGNVEPEKDTLDRADREGIPILRTSMTAFGVAGRLAALL
ncbi:MAG: serine kinase [Bacillota bacterium]|nr:MAG: serine kinase [Bacillota bacterium]